MEDILKKYNQSIANIDTLKKKVKKTLDRYESNLKAKKEVTEEQDDGWIKVHNPGRGGKIKKSNKKKKSKTSKVDLSFYAFEVKEAKLKKHKELLEKFEEDKKRLAKMRARSSLVVTEAKRLKSTF